MSKPRGVWRWRIRRKLTEWWIAAQAPWPIVAECHSWHREGHRCLQCDGSHVHRWVAWEIPTQNTYRLAAEQGVSVRCSRCGGRKCDRPDCTLVRHHRVPHASVRASRSDRYGRGSTDG